jgi:hypothetical protein
MHINKMIRTKSHWPDVATAEVGSMIQDPGSMIMTLTLACWSCSVVLVTVVTMVLAAARFERSSLFMSLRGSGTALDAATRAASAAAASRARFASSSAFAFSRCCRNTSDKSTSMRSISASLLNPTVPLGAATPVAVGATSGKLAALAASAARASARRRSKDSCISSCFCQLVFHMNSGL